MPTRKLNDIVPISACRGGSRVALERRRGLGSPSRPGSTAVAAGRLIGTVMLALATALHPVGAEQAKQKHFPAPEQASEALLAAVKAGKIAPLLEILGAEAKPIVVSGDPIADEEARAKFVAVYDQAHSLTATDATTQILEVGADRWPFPIPLVKDDAGWRFDTAAGLEEILARRIGRNELATIQACLAYAQAQREYYLEKPLGEPLRYAQKIGSSKGKRDGLYWPAAPGEPPSPLGHLFAEASAERYFRDSGPTPYFGYRYRILTKQGANAAGGAYDYIVHGKMIGGFALIASPARYGVSGVMTFMVNHDGVVFQKDLGPNTDSVAKVIKAFDPDASWKRVDDGDGAH
jgi:hypothetical protein